jgi:hypothetical protein
LQVHYRKVGGLGWDGLGKDEEMLDSLDVWAGVGWAGMACLGWNGWGMKWDLRNGHG